MENEIQLFDNDESGCEVAKYVPDDVKDIIKLSTNLMTEVNGAVTTISNTVVQIKQLSAQVELEFAKMDHMLDALMVRAQRDKEIYEQSLPVLDKQFAANQSRMDMLMMKTVDMILTDDSENALQKQEAMMNLIEITNQSLNNLIAKLIPSL